LKAYETIKTDYESDIFFHGNCVRCDRCVRVCPIMRKNEDCSMKTMRLGCISCGACLSVCPYNAIQYADDTIKFMEDLRNGEKITLLVAPAVLRHFSSPERLFGFLKNLGISSVHSVILYADITIWAYIEVLRKNTGFGYMASPCAAIVRYLQCHKPELRRNIMPVYSPLQCAVIYLRKYAKINTKFAFLSPCIAKRSEMRVTGKSMISYNITIGRLREYLNDKHIDIERYPTYGFDDFRPHNSAILNLYGGISESILPHIPTLKYYKIRGINEAYEFPDNHDKLWYQNGIFHNFVEVYNCEDPCDGGTGCGQNTARHNLHNKTINKQTSEMFEKNTIYANKIFSRFESEIKIADFMVEY